MSDEPNLPVDRVWLVHANGGRQLVDASDFDFDRLAIQASCQGGRLVVESPSGPPAPAPGFEPPLTALAALFRARLGRVHECKAGFDLQINARPTNRVLGNYYKMRRLVRIYTHDRDAGRRPLEELFDTFLHEVAHHLEYSEYREFDAARCGRVKGRMHSDLFWRILGTLKARWRGAQHG